MDYLDTALKTVLAILALFGAEKAFKKISIKFKKQSNTLTLHKSSEENVGRDKIVINNIYNFPTIGKKENLLQDPPPIEVVQVGTVSEIELDERQRFLVINLNKVHELCSQPYDFTSDYKYYIFHEKFKKTEDWYITASVYIANSIQNIGVERLFNCFEPEAEETKNIVLRGYKDKIRISYNELQKIRHAGKRGNLAENHLTPYEMRVLELKEPPISRIEDIFRKFQEDLNQIFTDYKLKNQI